FEQCSKLERGSSIRISKTEDSDVSLIDWLKRRPCCFRSRTLQDERSGIIGNAAHHIEPARSSRDENIGIATKESARPYRFNKPVERHYWISPHLWRAACNNGSICLRICVFANPAHATSVRTSSGDRRDWPAASVTMTPASRAISAVQTSYGWP